MGFAHSLITWKAVGRDGCTRESSAAGGSTFICANVDISKLPGSSSPAVSSNADQNAYAMLALAADVSDLEPQVEDALGILNNLISA